MALARILVVEDDPHIAHILRFQLEAAGYAVRTAENGREGLELVLAEPPDLVLTDLMMPVMDGHELCRRIKDDFRTAQIPVILLTAKAEVGDKVAAFDLGANDYVVKPHNRDELLLRVRNLLNWSRTQREANPLTGLPGNLAIEREVLRRLDSHAPFVFLYIDADNFKAFNDHYGYQRGDEAIRIMARLIGDVLVEHGNRNDFLGHVGGDDFVVVTTPDRFEAIGAALIARFDREIEALYRPEDRKRGHIKVFNRRGEEEEFPVMSVTVAAIPSNRYRITHLAQLNDLASELKQYGKSRPGSVVVSDRRTDDPASGKTGTHD
jgi:diguanylate cyclase (GGDEF)-like protein